MKKTFITHSPEETISLGEALARGLEDGDLVALIGELGSGKTVFVKGLAKGLGVGDYLYVNSPSFVVLKEYKGKKDLYHFDVYRLEGKSFEETLDYEKYFYASGITVVEWADKITRILPEEYLEVNIEYGKDESERIFTLESIGERSAELKI